MAENIQRLDKVVAAQTEYSRKDVHRLLSKGQVSVNGKAVRAKDTKINLQRDSVSLCGTELVLERFSYIMMNKPQGVVCATEDRQLKTVLDLVPGDMQRAGLFPAGRLDKDTTGFVLLTNDGAFAHDILAPGKHVPKVYEVWLDKPVSDEVMVAFRNGVVLDAVKNAKAEQGQHARCREIRCMPAEIKAADLQDRTHMFVTIRQGVYHQIKRMFMKFGIEVVGLHRCAIGGLWLDPALEEGQCRGIKTEELERIKQQTTL